MVKYGMTSSLLRTRGDTSVKNYKTVISSSYMSNTMSTPHTFSEGVFGKVKVAPISAYPTTKIVTKNSDSIFCNIH